jgi:hypothetical protein
MNTNKSNNQSCTLSYIPRMNIIKSEPSGQWDDVEYTKNNLNDIKKMANKFTYKKWAFIGVLTSMAPVMNPEVSKVFSSYHEELEKLGCLAMAFVEGKKLAIKAQAQRHHDVSSAQKLLISHFATVDEAVEWLKTLGL